VAKPTNKFLEQHFPSKKKEKKVELFPEYCERHIQSVNNMYIEN
jgi:hypothetical protein